MGRVAFVLLTLVAVSVVTPREDPRTPNDPLFPEQAGFHSAGRYSVLKRSRLPERLTVDLAPEVALDMPRAWTITTGSRAVVVAVMDDGFFYAHEDVAPNVWSNPGETGLDEQGFSKETNGLDDDGDGYVDNVVGWDFAFNDPDPDNYVFDGRDTTRIQPFWHGVEALGIIGG